MKDLLFFFLADKKIYLIVTSVSTLPRRVVSVAVCLGVILLIPEGAKRVWVQLVCQGNNFVVKPYLGSRVGFEKSE